MIKNPDETKKYPPNVYMKAEIFPKLTSVPAFWNTNDPEKYINAPSPAKRSTKSPLKFYWRIWQNGFFSEKALIIFHNWAIIMKDDAIIKKYNPQVVLLRTGMKHIDPTRYKKDPIMLTKKLIAKLKNLQSA